MPTPTMQTVDSSNLDSVGYDSQSKTLHVQFKGGARYAYADVPSSAHAALMAAPSKGVHLNANIIGKYQSQKVQ
jgi:hypothetical protein